jgi:hypothetical protein
MGERMRATERMEVLLRAAAPTIQRNFSRAAVRVARLRTGFRPSPCAPIHRSRWTTFYFAFASRIASRALRSSEKMFAGAASCKLPSATATPVKVGGMP